MDDLVGFRTRSMIAAPILFDDHLHGVLVVLNHKGGGAFPEAWKERMSVAGILYGAALSAAGRAPCPSNGPPPAARDHRAAEPVTDDARTTVVGISPAIRQALSLCRRVADSDVSVVISGETGTGKELAARRIHEESARSDGPFLDVNCAALSETLLESELFGHVKGAFTGAESDRRGKFVAASGGTLFLDEVAEMSPSCQAGILRALQEKKVTPVGSETSAPADVRVVSATNHDLWADVEAGGFRKDLYFRLCALEITMPPLRERPEDVSLLAAYFLDRVERDRRSREPSYRAPRLSADALETLSRLPWPGNVRQLEESLMAAVAICEGNEIGFEDFPPLLHRAMVEATVSVIPSPTISAPAPVDGDAERRRYIVALEATKYPGTGRHNVAAAARQLGIARKTFTYQLRKMGLI